MRWPVAGCFSLALVFALYSLQGSGSYLWAIASGIWVLCGLTGLERRSATEIHVSQLSIEQRASVRRHLERLIDRGRP